ncbi:MAG TPA: TIGR00282 family metallophosphoesterase [Candidatus Sabulitectum sp.]|nr:TIGR00282 family metallophosphoesterase [Candidatus Sabulitectum sp.]
MIVVNGENAAGGFGITPEIAGSFLEAGVSVITSGNHIWKRDSIIPMLEDPDSRILRPANYPPGNPGRGTLTLTVNSVAVQVLNLQGRVFTDFTGECPFRIADRLIDSTPAEVRIIDFHAEATSEKMALARHLDGRVSIVAGTHTHVQTADERILPGGTAYLTDLGMCGSADGVIGMETSSSIARFTSGRYSRLSVAEGSPVINGLEFQVDGGSVTGLKRISENG